MSSLLAHGVEVSGLVLLCYLNLSSCEKCKFFVFYYQNWNKIITPNDLGSFVTYYCQKKIESLGGVESDDELAGSTDEVKEETPSIEQNEDVYNDEKKKLPVHFEVALTVSCQYL